MLKLEESFEYHAEKARKSFQESLKDLIEFHQHLSSKVRNGRMNKKNSLFIHIDEADLMADHLLSRITDLMSHYDNMNRVNILLHKRQSINEAIASSHMELIKKALKITGITEA